MNFLSRAVQLRLALCCISITTAAALAQQPAEPYRPTEGQPGRDVVWIPTPDTMVEKMLDLAKVTTRDYVVDLGSGDGRNVIAAAKRGARALGVEYNPELVQLSRRAAAAAGVADRAAFVEGDMFEADISQATVLALFLVSDNLRRLTPRFLNLKPGTRIVSNTFKINDWSADETYKLGDDCIAWCTAHLYIVPARVAGSWRLANGELSLKKEFQLISGTYRSGGRSMPVENGILHGDQIRFSLGGASYTGRVNGDVMNGDIQGRRGPWGAARAR